LSSLFFGMLNGTGVPADEKVVRATAVPVSEGASPAVASAAPQTHGVDIDPNPELGMVERQQAPYYIPSVKSAPFWDDVTGAHNRHNEIIDHQISTSGTAAAREAAGQFGHGTMPVAIGIEPVGDLQDGGRLTNEYFLAHDKPIQSTMGEVMTTPPGYDQSKTVSTTAAGKQAARDAAQAALYSQWWNGGK